MSFRRINEGSAVRQTLMQTRQRNESVRSRDERSEENDEKRSGKNPAPNDQENTNDMKKAYIWYIVFVTRRRKPVPNNKPVINLFQFLDSYFVRN